MSELSFTKFVPEKKEPEPPDLIKVIFLRVPQWLHEEAIDEAKALGMSLNAFCRIAVEDLIAESGKTKGKD